MSDRDAWVLLEWDWALTATGWVLHHVKHLDNAERFGDDRQGGGRMTCGITTWLSVPGMFSRIDGERCKNCSRILGIPPGIGSPKNDKALRPWVEKRIAALPTPQEDPT